MHEFESVSASSYDPSALATKLTAKSADGWKVVAIVPTGGDVTAFLSRERDDDSSGSITDTTSSDTDKAMDADRPGLGTDTVKPEPVVEPTIEPEIEPVKAEPVSEPSGWAIAPEPPSPARDTSSGPTLPTATSTPAAAAASSAPATPTSPPTVQPAAAAQPAAAQPAAVPTRPEPAPSPTVPAGWYADPAGRFELRYWDGGTWTEHVSRAGQQFTDPPVA